MTRLLSILALCAVVLILPIITQRYAAQADSNLTYETTMVVPDSGNAKVPKAHTFGNEVYVAANPDDRATLWSKLDTANSFPPRTNIGFRGSQPQWETASVATGVDGTIYFAWINNEEQAIYFQRKTPTGGWESRVTVQQGGFSSPGAVKLDIGATSTGIIFIAWFESGQPFRYTLSTNGGASWAAARDLGDIPAYLSTPVIATGPSGQAMITFMGATDPLQIFAGIWNGSDFVIEQVTPLNLDYADPTAAIDSNGQYFAAFRSIGSGIYFAARQGDNSWATAFLASGDANGTVAISTDTENNLHVAWANNNPTDLYYTFKSPTGDWEGPLRVDRNGRDYFFARNAASLGARSYGHVVLEQFDGGNLSTRYFRFSANTGLVYADPQIESGASAVGGDATSVSVSFENVSGEPNQIRWHWGAEPTDADTWQNYANPISIALPSTLNTAGCTPLTLYTEVRNTSKPDKTYVGSDNISIDSSVQASIRAVNPYIGDKMSAAAQLLAASDGATDGHPDYTRDKEFYFEIQGASECSGLKQFALGKDIDNFGTPTTISNNVYADVVSLPQPDTVSEGPSTFAIRVTDNLSNSENISRTLKYDPIAPTLNLSGTLTITSSVDATIITTLDFSGVDVSDNLYPNGFWGAWIANSRTEAANPLTDAELVWHPVEVDNPGSSFTIENWSLASGLSESDLTEEDADGSGYTFYVYVRYFDGAGNLTDGWTEATIELSEIARPKVYLPMLWK